MNIIPKVTKTSEKTLKMELPIGLNGVSKDLLDFLNESFKTSVVSYCKNGINFVKSHSEFDYSWNFSDSRQINISSEKYIIDAIATLIQFAIAHNCVPVVVKDKSELEWRGVSFDIARTFYGVDDIIHMMFQYRMLKFNRMNLGLTNDQGWRIEIPGYDNLPTDGEFLTSSDVQKIMHASKLLGIDVVPEFNSLGHTQAMSAKIPNLLCNNKKVGVWRDVGVSKDVLCISRNTTISIVKDIWKKITNMFESEYVHIGGDECPHDNWNNCEFCKEYMKENNIDSDIMMRNYLNEIIEYLKNDLGKKVMAWDDIQEKEPVKDILTVFWRCWYINKTPGYLDNIAKTSGEIINARTDFVYLDWANRQEDTELLNLDKDWVTTIRKAYEFDPYDGISDIYKHLIKGSYIGIWTERLKTFKMVQYNIFPRTYAIADVVWHYGEKNYEEFKERLISIKKFTDILTPQMYSDWQTD